MLRRSVFAVILLLLVPVSIQATRTFDSIFFLPQKRCSIPVKMDIGMYVEILDMETLCIKLKQMDFDTFEGCTDIRIKSNFPLELGCEIEPTGMVEGEYSCSIDDPKVPLDLSENVAVREVHRFLWEPTTVPPMR